jgi:hypothetical protein
MVTPCRVGAPRNQSRNSGYHRPRGRWRCASMKGAADSGLATMPPRRARTSRGMQSRGPRDLDWAQTGPDQARTTASRSVACAAAQHRRHARPPPTASPSSTQGRLWSAMRQPASKTGAGEQRGTSSRRPLHRRRTASPTASRGDDWWEGQGRGRWHVG